MNQLLFVGIFIFYSLNCVQAQRGEPLRTLTIKKAKGPIVLDGKLDENDWITANKAQEYYQNFPSDTSKSITKTISMITYDDHNIYVAAICQDEMPGNYVIQSLKRDFGSDASDMFAVYFDPFNNGLTGFNFCVNPLGVQREGLIQEGGGRGVSAEWDNKWFSHVERYTDKWIVEMAIPFKTIRYKDATIWGLNFSRNELKRNENSSWSHVPTNQDVSNFSFLGRMQWDAVPAEAGANFSIIPYAITNLGSDYVNDKNHFKPNAGMDTKIAITSSLNLDLTINPDFSQVEVDKQQTNLTRFSLFFPEKRQFFIENSDLFSKYGFSQIRPFFSRNIGLHEISPGRYEQVPILGGARLSGNLNKKWRIGVLETMTGKQQINTGENGSLDIPMQNYFMATLKRQLFQRSSVSALYVSRMSPEKLGDYNNVLGGEFYLATSDNKWTGKVFYHKLFTNDKKADTYANASWLLFNNRSLFWMWNHEYVGKNYTPDVGFVPRNTTYNPEKGVFEQKAYYRLEPIIEGKIYPSHGPINHHAFKLYVDHYMDVNLKTTDYKIQPSYKAKFNTSAEIIVNYEEKFTHLFYDFSFSDSAIVYAGDYNYRSTKVVLQSNKRNKLYGFVSANYGSFYTGIKTTLDGQINYRTQPWGIVSTAITYNQIQLNNPKENINFLLVGPKVQLSFSRNLFLTTFVQYNTQISNVNVNARLQWRFKPMSDLYIVYTDNYDPFFNIQNRALAVKFIYWISI